MWAREVKDTTRTRVKSTSLNSWGPQRPNKQSNQGACLGLTYFLCIYVVMVVQLCVLMELLIVGIRAISDFFQLVFGNYSSHWIALSNLNMRRCVQYYCNLIRHVCLISWEACLFLKEDRVGLNLVGSENGRDLKERREKKLLLR